MKTEQKELYVYTKDHFSNDMGKISKECVDPLVAVRQVVKRAMEKYVKDYCGTGTKIEEVFSEEDFQTVSNRLYNEL